MLLTKYADTFNSEKPLQDYPRPQLKRESYINLNGRWDFKISTKSNFPEKYDDIITVPYCVESYLSGINKHIEKGDYLFYRKYINLEKKFIKDKVILHFGAIDQIAKIFINRQIVAESNNGYLPISVDIKPFLKEKDNEIIVMVKDDMDLSYPYGKQKTKRGGMWYTKVSGIWQSVWLESVTDDYVSQLTITPDIDNSKVNIVVNTNSEVINLKIKLNGKTIYNEKSNNGIFDVKIDKLVLWNPENPVLYDVEIKTKNDEVSSYFAMRKFSSDNKFIYLNNKKIFLNGLLDQGYFPDGIFTPASYEAYKDDILTMKKLGFNCLRKHIKIEPLLFYHYCDVYGMIILQDMVNNGPYSFVIDTAMPTLGLSSVAKVIKNSKKNVQAIFEDSMIKTINHLYNIPCVGYYTIFNEGWGQHNADYYYKLAKSIDKTRIIDSTSGWFKENDSDVESLHVYFKKIKIKKANRPIIVSEFGGYALSTLNHVYNKDVYGYKILKDYDSFNNSLMELYENDILNNIKNGLAGCIYTQVSDIEDEINGLFTYDRKVLKVDEKKMLEMNEKIYKEFKQ